MAKRGHKTPAHSYPGVYRLAPQVSRGVRSGSSAREVALQAEVDRLMTDGWFAELAGRVLLAPEDYRWIKFGKGESALRDEMAAHVEHVQRQLVLLEKRMDATREASAREEAQLKRDAESIVTKARHDAASLKRAALIQATAELDDFAELVRDAAPSAGFLGIQVGETETRQRILGLATEMESRAAGIRQSN